MCAKQRKKSFSLKEYIADPKNKDFIIKVLTVVLVVSILGAGLLIVKRTFLDSNISWTLSEDGVLTVSGTGAIKDFDPLKPDEWLKLKSGETVKEIVICEGITEIGNYAFYKCNKATEIRLPKSLKSVGDFAFMGCTKITDFEFKGNLNSIGKGAFYGCSAAKTFSLTKGVKSIGYDAFYGTGYYNIKDIRVNGALYIDNYLIDVKEDTKGDFTAKEGTVLVADYAFSGCTKLEKATLPKSTVSLGKYAFNGCTALKQVIFDGKIEAFSEGLFWNCTALEKITGEHIFNDPTYYEKNAGDYWNRNAGTAHGQNGDKPFIYTKD